MVLVSKLAECMAKSSPPWAAYCTLMAYHLVSLDKIPGVLIPRIGETICWAWDKLFMRAAGDQAKMARGNLQLYACLESRTEGATHAMEETQRDGAVRRRRY